MDGTRRKFSVVAMRILYWISVYKEK